MHMHAPVPMLPSRPRPCIYTPKHPPIQQQPRAPLLIPQSTVYRYFVVQQGHLERVQGPLPYHWAHWRQPSSGVHWAQQIEKSDGPFFFWGTWASQGQVPGTLDGALHYFQTVAREAKPANPYFLRANKDGDLLMDLPYIHHLDFHFFTNLFFTSIIAEHCIYLCIHLINSIPYDSFLHQ